MVIGDDSDSEFRAWLGGPAGQEAVRVAQRTWRDDGSAYNNLLRIAYLRWTLAERDDGPFNHAPPGENCCGSCSAAIQIIQRDERRRCRERLREAVNDACTCDGRGPGDPQACGACLAWHALGGERAFES